MIIDVYENISNGLCQFVFYIKACWERAALQQCFLHFLQDDKSSTMVNRYSCYLFVIGWQLSPKNCLRRRPARPRSARRHPCPPATFSFSVLARPSCFPVRHLVRRRRRRLGGVTFHRFPRASSFNCCLWWWCCSWRRVGVWRRNLRALAFYRLYQMC